MEETSTQDVNQETSQEEKPKKRKTFLDVFEGASESLLNSYGQTFNLLADKLFNIKLIFMVVKGYIKDLIKNPDDEDLKQGITDETNNYKENVEEIQKSLIIDNKQFQELTKNANLIKNFEMDNHQIKKESYDFFIDKRHKLDSLLEQLNEYILTKQITFCNKIISIVQLEDQSHYPLLEEVFTKAITNLERAFKLVNEGHIEIKKIKTNINGFKKTLEDKIEVMQLSDSEEALDEYLEDMGDVFDSISESDDEGGEGSRIKGSGDDESAIIDDESLEKVESPYGATKLGKEAGIEVLVKTSGVYLKLLPSFDGQYVANIDEIKRELEARKISVPPDDVLENIISAEHEKFFKIGEWSPDPQNDASVSLEFNEDKTEAYIRMSMPKYNGRIAEKRDIINLLKEFNVVHGVDEKAINEAIQKQIYGKPILVAKGEKPEKGNDAEIKYNFRLNFEPVNFKQDEYGRVDFKNLDLIQNVFSGQMLAEKTIPTEGKPGKNVCGEEIPPISGTPVDIIPGNNVRVSDDGMQAFSEIGGHVYLSNGAITVDPVYTVEGNVDYNTGNIEFIGTVVVKGDVLDGFSIKADGDIQVTGTVGKAKLRAENDIMLSSGINGKGGGDIKAGGKIYAKFIENVEQLKAGDDIVVENNILHSYIESKSNIICMVKKGLIAGGKIIAGRGVEANILGTNTYASTVLIVGVDRELEKRREELQKEMYFSKIYLVKIKRIVNKLKDKKNRRGYLTKLWQETSKSIISKRTEEENNFKKLLIEHKEVTNLIEELRKDASIKSHTQVYPKVMIYIGPLSFNVKNELGKIMFVLGDKKVLLKPLKE